MCPMRMRTFLVLGTLLLASSAQAMVAVDLFREPLRQAAHHAAACEGAIPGDYSVTVSLGDGAPRVELRRQPGVSVEASACIEQAFARATYPDSHHGTIRLNYPFRVRAAEE